MHHPPNKAASVQIRDGRGAGTFLSRALWCSKSDFNALSTSSSLVMPAGDCACRLTTVIRRDRSCRETRHSRCSSSSCRERPEQHHQPQAGIRGGGSSQPHAKTKTVLRHVGIPPVQSKVRLDLPGGPVVKTPHFCRGRGFNPQLGN